MKVAILGTRGIPARYGGFETFAEKLSIGLAEMGFDVTVFCEEGQSAGPAMYRGVRLRYLSAPALGPLQTIVFDVKSLWAARKGYDIVYMLGYGAAPFCMIPRLWNTEVWINPDGLEWARAKWGLFARNYFRMMEWFSIKTANRLIADAAAIEASLAERHGAISKCTVIPYGCEVIDDVPPTEPLAQWGLARASYYVVVCRLEPENHLLEILRAFKSSSSSKQLIVVGDHRSASRYVQQLRLIHDPRIRMIGTVYDQAKLTALRYHSFGYMHGHSVGGTNPSLLEAMGCGNLIFAHDNPFNRETLGSSAQFFASDRELTTNIELAEKDGASANRLREGAKMRARKNYRWADIISTYADLIVERTVQVDASKSQRRHPHLTQEINSNRLLKQEPPADSHVLPYSGSSRAE
jgi:glycosyltransferase involved in cell wall biosynthesis